MARVVLAMSGGVDSSVAAHLLSAAGHEVIGLFMRHGEPAAASLPVRRKSRRRCRSSRSAHKQGCCTASDAADARRVADRLGISFYALDFQEEFGRIVDYFVAEYTSGRTPNPCVMCNNWLKFGKLCEYADSIGAEFVATGHYARLLVAGRRAHEPALCRGRGSRAKISRTCCSGSTASVLPRLLFPVGGYEKHEIRAMAREMGLRVADKKDSQEICFVPEGDYAAFVDRHEGGRRSVGRNCHGRRRGRRPARRLAALHHRPAQGVGRGVGRRAAVCGAAGARTARRVVIGTREQLGRSRVHRRSA